MGLINKAIIAIQRVGLINTMRFVRYAQKRDRLERQAGCSDIETGPPQAPGLLQKTKPIQSGVIFDFEHSSLEVRFLAGDLVRLSWSPGKEPVPYSIAHEEWPPTPVDLLQEGAGWQIRSDQLTIFVVNDGSVQFCDFHGRKLHLDFPPERADRPGLRNESAYREPHWSIRSVLEPETGIYGLGLRAFPLDLRGRTCRMWNSDPPGGYGPGVDPLYLCIPVYLSVHDLGSCLIFYENSFPGVFSFPEAGPFEFGSDPHRNRSSEAEVCFEGGMLRYYFIPGPPERALKRYSQLTGRAPIPPRWALGYHQSRWGYQSEAEIREIAAGFKKHQLPLSAIHLDIDYMDGFRVFTVDSDRFPNLPGLAEDLAREGIQIVSILDPGVKFDSDYGLYQDGLAGGMFCSLSDQKPLQAQVWPGWSVFPDFTHPKVRKWWGSHYPLLLSKGITGIWHDMNEPASFAAWGDFTLPVPTIHALEGRGGNHLEAHNLYGLEMDQAGFEALREFHPEARPWLLSRSGWAGLARYAWSWTGDIETSWEALRQTVSSILGLGLCGIPFSGSDIGGFLGHPDPELYLRWFQMAAFMPFFRTHSSKEVPPREPWRFGEPALGIIRKYLQLRYRLIPYLYTLAWEACQSGWPLVRPLFWPAGDDPLLRKVDDAFLLGNALLVAPILEPGADSREVRLPPGEWFDYWDDKVYNGSSLVSVSAPLERIPVLVRAGSILPMEENDVLQLHFYPDANGESQGYLYSDAGDGYGDWRLDHFKSFPVEYGVAISRIEEGEFPFPYNRVRVNLHGVQAKNAWVDGQEIAVRGSVLESRPFEKMMIMLKTS